jgi:predicted RNA-binding Zn-ribbon protein involved in translation (DUF1610 family)/ribosomal protein S27E
MQSKVSRNQQFPCLSCGAKLEFSPRNGHLECPYCGQEKQITHSNVAIVERPYEAFLEANHRQIAALSATAQEVECPGCHAQFAFEPPTIAGQCPFCSTSIVAQPHGANPIVTPEAVLPFCVDQKTAKENVQRWLQRRWFAPTGLGKLSQQEKIQGIYLPFWTYDSQTSSHYRGERGDHYTVTETYSETNSEGQAETKTREVQKIRWTSVSGQVSRCFNDLLVAGTEAIKCEHLNAISDWDLLQLEPYNSSYLAGFKAQRYQIDLEEGFERSKGQMTDEIRSDVERDIGGDDQRVNSISTSYSQITFKHILLPVWVSSYQFKNQPYSVMVNARTGKVAGDRPFSLVKISLTVLAVVTTVTGIFGIKIYLDDPAALPSMQIPSIDLSVPSQPYPVSPKDFNPNDSSFSTPSQPPLSSTLSVQSDEEFRQAIALAQTAVSRGQLARNSRDWKQIVSLWEQAIISMTKVPSSSRNYAVAKQKATEYQRYLNYARQQSSQSAP